MQAFDSTDDAIHWCLEHFLEGACGSVVVHSRQLGDLTYVWTEETGLYGPVRQPYYGVA